MDALVQNIPDIVAATPASARSQTEVFGEMNPAVQVTGTDNAWFAIRGWMLSAPRGAKERFPATDRRGTDLRGQDAAKGKTTAAAIMRSRRSRMSDATIVGKTIPRIVF